MRTLHVHRLGRVEYEDGLAMQQAFVAARAEGRAPDTLLLLEHPPVITLGRGAKDANVLWDEAERARAGLELFETSRGGDVTYHGPGQVVGYPILDLKPDRRDVRKYVGSVEELMIRVARDFGVEAARAPGRPGIWVDTPRGPEKLGAIGVHLSRWITSHGFAFNVATDLSHFGAIVPCGIEDAGVCSLGSLLGRAPPLPEVLASFARRAGEVWESEPSFVEPALFTVAVAIVRPGPRGDELLLLLRTPGRGGFWQPVTGRIEGHEPALQAAARELYEETGFAPALDQVLPCGVPHAFALGDRLAVETPFAVRVPAGAEPAIDPNEHVAWQWLPLDEALPLIPFAGLKRLARLALATR